MAIDIEWDGITSGTDTGDTVESKLTNTFSNIEDSLNANETDIANNDSRLTAIESVVPAVIVMTGYDIAEQTLVPDTPEVFECMETEYIIDGTAFSSDTNTNTITVLEDCICRVAGSLSVEAPINDMVILNMYKDNLPTPFKSTVIGRGIGNPVSISFYAMSDFVINDELNIYVTSTGSTVKVDSFTMVVEKTRH